MSDDLETVHTFCQVKQPDGCGVINIFKRVDLHRMDWVGQVSFLPGIDPETLGGLVCESFNSELRTRGAAAKENDARHS